MYERIRDKRECILTLWQAAVLPQNHGFSRKSTESLGITLPSDNLLKDQSALLFDWLVSDEEPIKARPGLKEICRVKAVAATNPSEALGFILDLKEIIRMVLKEGEGGFTDFQASELCDLDRRIDQLMILAFDEYTDCREQIMEIRLDEVRRLAGRLAR